MTNKYLIPLLTSSILACSISPVWGENTQPDITFSCEDNDGVPITVARNKEVIQTIFHWKEEVLQLTTQTPLKLCDAVSSKMNKISIRGYELSSFGLIATKLNRLSIICLNGEMNHDCSKILLATVSQEEPIVAAHNILKTILDPEIVKIDLATKRRRERGFAFTGYRVNLLELFEKKQ